MFNVWGVVGGGAEVAATRGALLGNATRQGVGAGPPLGGSRERKSRTRTCTPKHTCDTHTNAHMHTQQHATCSMQRHLEVKRGHVCCLHAR